MKLYYDVEKYRKCILRRIKVKLWELTDKAKRVCAECEGYKSHDKLSAGGGVAE